MTHDQLVAALAHDQRVDVDLLLECLFGRPVPHGTPFSPSEQYASDTALIEGKGLAVTSGSAAYLTAFEPQLDHRISQETNALGATPHIAGLHHP